jgi:hypothetical protein
MGKFEQEAQLDLKNNNTKDLYDSEDVRKFISILNKFFEKEDWIAPTSCLDEILESCMLPTLE